MYAAIIQQFVHDMVEGDGPYAAEILRKYDKNNKGNNDDIKYNDVKDNIE